jgi:hypothetical protein
MGFFPSLADKDILMRDKCNHYEYIADYVDNLAIGSKAPKEITDELKNTYKFKLKGTGPIKFHLGCDFYRDEDGTLCFGPKKYIEKMVDAYLRMFGSKPTAKVQYTEHHKCLQTMNQWSSPGVFLITGSTSATKHCHTMPSKKQWHQECYPSITSQVQ